MNVSREETNEKAERKKVKGNIKWEVGEWEDDCMGRWTEDKKRGGWQDEKGLNYLTKEWVIEVQQMVLI